MAEIKTYILFIIILLLTGCASTIKTTGTIILDTKINKIEIVCITPDKVGKFSNNLCERLKNNLTSFGLVVTTDVIDEMTPTLGRKSDTNSVSQMADLTLQITHIRINLYNGMPCGTLMNINLYKKADTKPIWNARVQTKGTNLTGPGNADKVSLEIIQQMKLDGLKL